LTPADLLKWRPDIRRALLQKLETGHGNKRLELRDKLFPVQRAFVESAAKRKSALCSRRAGKTFGLAAWLYDDALATPGKMSCYISGEGLPQARRNIGPALAKLSAQLNLEVKVRTIDGQLIYELPNGHQIWVSGCDKRPECDKYRGAGEGYTRVVIDEAGTGAMPGYLEYLIDEVLDPALLDQQGDLALAGTPGVACAGLFYTATTGDGGQKWDPHHWTLLDNPHLPDPRAFLDAKKREKGWDDKTVIYRREYLGEWVKDNSILALPFDWTRNALAALPDGPDYDTRIWDYVLGVDVGVAEAPSAFVILATPRGLPDMFVTRAWIREGLTPSSMAAEIQRVRQELPLIRIILDTGGLGAGYAAEMVERHHIPVEAAKKQDKRTAIEVVRGELLSGNLRIIARESAALVDELKVLPMNEKGDNFDSAHFDCHAADALVYAVRMCRPLYNEREEGKTPTVDEYNRQRMAEHKAKAGRTAIANARRNARIAGKLGI
jgi:hypothetical protein